MNSFFTKENGVTLVAMVISIVIFIIVAAITISSIVNENVVGKAQEASAEYARSTAMDDIKIDLISVQKQHQGRITEDLFYETVEKYGTISERNMDTGYLTTTNGNYRIALIELFDGAFSEELPDEEEPEDPDDPNNPDNPGGGSNGNGNGNGGSGQDDPDTPTEEPKGFYARYYTGTSKGNVLVISNTGSFDYTKVTKRDESLASLYNELASTTNYQAMANGTVQNPNAYPWQFYTIHYVFTIGTDIPVPTLEGFFKGCKELYYIDLSGCKLSNCRNASYMFAYTEGLNINHFDVDMSAVTDMSYFFSGNKNVDLTRELSYIDIKNVTSIEGMFNGASIRGNKTGYIKESSYSDNYIEISYLDLTSFDFTKIAPAQGFQKLFYGTNSLHYVLLNKTWQMNYYCPNSYTKTLYELRSRYQPIPDVYILEVD